MNYVFNGKVNNDVIGSGTINRGKDDFENNNITYYIILIIFFICIGIYIHYLVRRQVSK